MRTALLLAIVAFLPAGIRASDTVNDEPVAARKPTLADGQHAEDPLQLAIQAAAHATENLTSAVASGTFKRFEQQRTDKEPKLWTEAKVDVFFDRGKYHLRFTFQRLLRRTTYQDPDGGLVEEKTVDWKPEDYILIYDGTTAHSITFSDRIHPTGCRVEIFSNVRRAANSAASFQWNDIARPWHDVLNLEKTIANLGRDAIQVENRPEGLLRCTYRIKNSPRNKVEFDLHRKTGFRVANLVVNHDAAEAAVHREHLTWKNTDGIWHVTRVVDEYDLRELRDDGLLRRSVFEYTSFKPNVKVDPQLFTLQAMEIPAGTRFIDRRRSEVR